MAGKSSRPAHVNRVRCRNRPPGAVENARARPADHRHLVATLAHGDHFVERAVLLATPAGRGFAVQDAHAASGGALLGLLHAIEAGIEAIMGQQFGVRALFLLLAMSQRNDAVGTFDSR